MSSINIIVAIYITINDMHNNKFYLSMSISRKYEYIAIMIVKMIYAPMEIGKSVLGPVISLPLR